MTIDRQSLIINSAFECPTHHWQRQGDDRLELVAGRRPAGYEIFDTRNKTLRTVELPLVNSIRQRVNDWRAANYPGVTQITRQLLEHWRDPETRRLYEFYFCQLEAIETLIWWVEAAAEFKQGIAIPGDGGAWERLCNKMATGSGKTTVMAMIITWQVLNALTYPKRNKDFSRAIFIVTPGLTVKERLKVLYAGHPENYYDAFALCPNEGLGQKLNQAGSTPPTSTAPTTPLKPSASSRTTKSASSANTVPSAWCWRRGMRWRMVEYNRAHYLPLPRQRTGWLVCRRMSPCMELEQC